MDDLHPNHPVPPLPPELDRRMDDMLLQLRSRLDQVECEQQIPIHQRRIPRRLAMAAGWVLLAAVVTFFTLGDPPVSWARMERSFRSVNAFQATFLFHQPPSERPEQIDLWISSQQRARLQSAHQVVFAHHNQPVSTIQVPSLSETTPGKQESFILELLGDAQHFSLQSLVEALPGDVHVTLADALVTTSNPEALTVFDVAFQESPEWIRIWALRESGLPIQLKYWDPSNGFGIEVFFSYEEEQQADFYLSDAFLKEAKNPHWQDNPAFFHLILKKDPAQHPLTPWDIAPPPPAPDL